MDPVADALLLSDAHGGRVPDGGRKVGNTHSRLTRGGCARVFHLMRSVALHSQRGQAIVGWHNTHGRPDARTVRGPNLELILSVPCDVRGSLFDLARPSLPVMGRRDIAHSFDRDEQPHVSHLELPQRTHQWRFRIGSWQHRSGLYADAAPIAAAIFLDVTEAAIPSLALERHTGTQRHA